jgi:hypothetical protein
MKTRQQSEVTSYVDRPILAPPFEAIFQKILMAPRLERMNVMAEFAVSLTNSESFNLARLEELPEDCQLLCLKMFEYCLSTGLTEDERQAASDALTPFAQGVSSSYLH